MKEKREVVVPIRLTKKEYKILKDQAANDERYKLKTGSINLSRYIRECVFVHSHMELGFHKEINALIYQIRKIGVNINQATAKINAGYRGMEAADRILNSLNEIEREVGNLIKKLDGNYENDEY